MEIFGVHLLSFRPAADFQSLAFADGHLETQGDPHVSQILRSRVKGDALHTANALPAAGDAKHCEREVSTIHTLLNNVSIDQIHNCQTGEPLKFKISCSSLS